MLVNDKKKNKFVKTETSDLFNIARNREKKPLLRKKKLFNASFQFWNTEEYM